MKNLSTSLLPKLIEYPLKVEKIQSVLKVYDPIRLQFVILTPEEYVRQQFIQHCLHHNIPKSRIIVEKQIHGSKKRFDIIITNQAFEPTLLVECKAEHITLDEDVIIQISYYNQQLRCPMTLITNGSHNIVTAASNITDWEEFFFTISSN